jgi:hypothetical protein
VKGLDPDPERLGRSGSGIKHHESTFVSDPQSIRIYFFLCWMFSLAGWMVLTYGSLEIRQEKNKNNKNILSKYFLNLLDLDPPGIRIHQKLWIQIQWIRIRGTHNAGYNFFSCLSCRPPPSSSPPLPPHPQKCPHPHPSHGKFIFRRSPLRCYQYYRRIIASKNQLYGSNEVPTMKPPIADIFFKILFMKCSGEWIFKVNIS